MAKKNSKDKAEPLTPKAHIRQLIDWMAQGVYEKEQIIAMALLCAVVGENIFLLGPPGTANRLRHHLDCYALFTRLPSRLVASALIPNSR